MFEPIDLLSFRGTNLNPTPLEFTNEMTTTKWLAYILKRVNELITYINEYEDKSQQYTDAEIKKLDTALRELIELTKQACIRYTDTNRAEVDAEISRNRREVDSSIAENRAELDADIAGILARIVALEDDLGAYEYTDEEVAKLRLELLDCFNALNYSISKTNEYCINLQQQINTINKVVTQGSVYVRSPISCKLMSIEEALFEMFDAYRLYLTCEELAEMEYTYGDIAGLDLTIEEYRYWNARHLGKDVEQGAIIARLGGIM